MGRIADIQSLALVGNYLPRKCGIATFTSDLYQAVADQYPSVDCSVAAVNDVALGYRYPREVRLQFAQHDVASYLRVAHSLNASGVDLVCLQHEYGIFGGPAGRHILAMLEELRMPVVTTLHTVLRDPSPEYLEVMLELSELSSRLVVMSQRGRMFLKELYEVPERKIDVIHHGIPDMPLVDTSQTKQQLGVAGKQVVLTFGLLSPNKGIEYALQALPEVIREFPNLIYIVVGATHPNLVRQQGESYRQSLEQAASELGISDHVIFCNRFVERSELMEFIAAADIYLTPYLDQAQITSGTLAYAFGCGKAVVSTPYWHAEELLAEDRGVLVPFRDSGAIARGLCQLLRDKPRQQAMCRQAYQQGREMVWGHVGRLYMDSFQRASWSQIDQPIDSDRGRAFAKRRWTTPDWRFDHLLRMTDSTGMYQHARFTLPNFDDGYCTDDNARALLLSMYLEELGQTTPQLELASTRYAAFLNGAFNAKRRTFRNFLSFDRRWLDDGGSEDCFGRALCALGACIGRSRQSSLKSWAEQLYYAALPASLDLSFPRGWAATLLSVHEATRREAADLRAEQIREMLSKRLVDLYEENASEDWAWFEDLLSYDNARLPQALILSGFSMADERVLQIGLDSLGWLVEKQRSAEGHFRPIGCKGFYQRDGQRAEFDQQPIEAVATVAACLDAYRVTGESSWVDEAKLAFHWFLGRNDLGMELYDSTGGGCRDGLEETGVNENQGAESTLAFLLAMGELELLEHSLSRYPRAAELVTSG